MNIEQAIDILKNSIADYVIGEYCEKCADNKICYDRNEDCYYQQAIDIVVTAYENLKSYNRGTKEALKVAEDLERQANKEAGDWETRYFELKQEFEKEKETSHYIQSQLDIANAKLVEEKEKNMELTNSYNQAIKETNEENKRCMLLAVENQDLKEKNKKVIDFINNKNNYFEDGENWQNILKIKEILEE